MSVLFPWINSICLATTGLLVAAAVRHMFPGVQVDRWGQHGLIFYCEVTLAQNVPAELLQSEIDRTVQQWAAADQPIRRQEMLPTNAVAFLLHKKSAAAEVLRAEESEADLVTLAQVDGAYFVAEEEIADTTGAVGGCRICRVTPLGAKRWRLEGCAVPERWQLKGAVQAFKRAERLDYFQQLADRDLWLADPGVWLPRALAWRRSLTTFEEVPLPPHWVATAPSASDEEILTAHLAYAAAVLPQGEALPLLVAEKRSPIQSSANEDTGLLAADCTGCNLYSLCVEADTVPDWLISSLQLIEKTYKIFGIEYRWVWRCAKPKNSLSHAVWRQPRQWLQAAITAGSWTGSSEESFCHQLGPCVELEVFDRWGKSWVAARLQVIALAASLIPLAHSPQGAPCVGAVLHYHLIALERLMALLLEQPGFTMPLWLAPEQLRLLTIAPREIPYATTILTAAQEMGVRAYLDATAVPLDRKIFRAERAAVPLIAIIGAQEAQQRTVALRSKRQRSYSVEHFLDLLPRVSSSSPCTIEEFKSRLEGQ